MTLHAFFYTYCFFIFLPLYPRSCILFLHYYYSFPGSAVLDNGCKYEGTFQYGLMHGKGKFYWSDGVEYEGNFNRGKVLLFGFIYFLVWFVVLLCFIFVFFVFCVEVNKHFVWVIFFFIYSIVMKLVFVLFLLIE